MVAVRQKDTFVFVGKSRLFRVAVLALLASVLAVTAFDNFTRRLPAQWIWPSRYLAAIIVVALLSRMMTRRGATATTPAGERLGRLHACAPTKGEIHRNANRVVERYKPFQASSSTSASGPPAPTWESPIDLFGYLLVDDLSHISSLREEVQVVGDLLTANVSMEVSLAHLKIPPQREGDHPHPPA